MKKEIVYLPAIIICLTLFTWSCESDDTSPSGDFSSQHQFVAMHWNADSNAPPYFSLLNIDNGEPDFNHLTDVYPYYTTSFNAWKQSFHQANGVLGFTLHEDLSETVTNNHGEELTRWTGAWMDMRDGEMHELPTLNPCFDFGYDSGCGRYSFTRRNSVRIGKSGHVFYVAMSRYTAGGWHTEPRYRIIRLDPQTGEYEVSPLISGWTNGQPEINAETYGLASIRDLLPTADGRHVYGITSAWGISGGNLIGSNDLLFRYDFDAEEYSRVDEVPYNISLIGITADDRNILYWDADFDRYRYDTHTGQSIRLDEANPGFSYQTMMHNQGGIGGAYPLRQLWHGNIIEDKIYKIPVPNHPDKPVFSADGSQVYFRYRNSEINYLLRLNNLTEEATVDTVAILPQNVHVMTIY